MAKWIEFPRSEGVSSRQAHADLPPGTYEREMGREGFFGPSTQMYHRHAPTGWSRIEGPLRPRAFDTCRIEQLADSPWEATKLLGNDSLALRIWRTARAMRGLVRNADGDELLFVHAGEAQLFCDYGHLALREGDFLLLPRGTLWRIEPASAFTALLLEAANESFRLPDRGMIGSHAPFDTAILDTPAIDEPFRAQQNEQRCEVVVKRRDRLSTLTYPFNPLDAVGWHGTLAPVRFNWRDIRPVMSHRVHLPPSVHTLLVAPRLVLSAFCPRPIEADPGSLKVPFFHDNEDYDEAIFYHRGQFFSRDNIHPGMLTLHPSGCSHGPHPKAFRAGAGGERSHTDEVAVMIDARDGLDVAPLASGVEREDYVNSWQEKAHGS